MEDIWIGVAVPEDARGITNVLHKTWLATYPNEEIGITVEDIEDSYKNAYSQERLQKMQNRIAEHRENEKMLVATKGDLVVGDAMIVRNEDNNQLRTIYVPLNFKAKALVRCYGMKRENSLIRLKIRLCKSPHIIKML